MTPDAIANAAISHTMAIAPAPGNIQTYRPNATDGDPSFCSLVATGSLRDGPRSATN
jgi:hypothetical protein